MHAYLYIFYASPGIGHYGKFCRARPELPFLPENGRATIFWKFGALWSVGAPPQSPIYGTLFRSSHKMPENPWQAMGFPERRYKYKKWLGWEFLVGIPSKTFYGNYWNNWRIFSKMPPSPPALSTAFTPSIASQPFKAISAIVTSNPTITPITQILRNTLKIMS